MKHVRSLALFMCVGTLLSGCVGTSAGRSLFGSPSNNVIEKITLSFPTKPNRASGVPQVFPINVNAYDRWGNLITVPYSSNIVLSSNGAVCELQFAFYTTTLPTAFGRAHTARSIVVAQATPSPSPTATPTTAPTAVPTSGPQASVAWNTPTQPVAVIFDPTCFPPGPNPVTITASSSTSNPTKVSF